MPMTLRDTQREIRKAAKKSDLKDAGASAALGGSVGAAAMPMRPIKPRGKRQAEAQALWSQAERAGGKSGGKANVRINPDNFVRLGQVKGHRLFNDSRVADMAHKTTLPKKDPRHIDEKKLSYTTTLFRDEKGNVTPRQQNGRHGAEALAMRGKNIPARVHMVDGPAPTEKNAVKAVYRHFASNWEGKKMGSNLRLQPKSIESKARKYPGFAHKINEAGHERLGYKAGSANETLPWRHGKALTTKQLRTKQAAYVGGGAVALVGANYASEKFAGKGVGNETIKYGKTGTDYTRHQVADIINPDKKVKKNLTPISKASDRTERTAAGATGATAGVMLMPMRDKIGKPAKEFATKYKNVKSGKVNMSSRDLQTIAAPGFREKKKIWKDPKTNLAYTDKMGAAIKRGKMSPARPRVVIYDDAARITGGQHRVHATAYAGHKTQRAEVVRVKGYYGGTEMGHKAIRSRIKRATYPKMFLKHTPKNNKELMRRDKAISAKSVAAARKGATDTDRVPFHKPMTKTDLRMLKGKQAAYITGGAGTVVAAREMYRRNHG